MSVLKIKDDNNQWHSITSITGQPTDEQIQDAVDEYLTNHPTATGTFTNEAKNALLALLEKVAYIDDNGQTYLETLRTELFRINVDSISAVFTQGQNVIYDTDSLDTLKQYLVVTANYSDGSSSVLDDSVYTLSGTLTEGTSTITVSYGGKTTTFSVAVTGTVDVTPPLSQFTAANAQKTGVSYNSQTDSLRIYTLTNWQYVAAEYTNFIMEQGYDYLVRLDMAYVSGIFRAGFCAGSSLETPFGGPATENTHIEFIVPYDSTIDRIKLFVTWSTSEAGDCTVSNFKVIKRPVSS